MIRKFTIYGERCSGTNYLEQLVLTNFDAEVTWDFGWKHWFGFDDLSNTNDILFICIVRNPHDWMNSLWNSQHHLTGELLKNKSYFINSEFISYNKMENNKYEEEMKSRNIYTNEKYKNIFEMRHVKLQFLINDLPEKVKNYLFIKYEDLIDDFDNTMNKIKNAGLIIKENIEFPINIKKYIFPHNDQTQKKKFKKIQRNDIPKHIIYKHPNFNKFYEKKIGYIK